MKEGNVGIETGIQHTALLVWFCFVSDFRCHREIPTNPMYVTTFFLYSYLYCGVLTVLFALTHILASTAMIEGLYMCPCVVIVFRFSGFLWTLAGYTLL